MNERVQTGIHVVWTVASIFPYLNLERIWSWSITRSPSRRAAETFKRMQPGTKASRYCEGSGRKSTLSGWMMLDLSGVRMVWHVIQTDGTMDRWESRRDGTSSRLLTRNCFFLVVASAESLKYFSIVDSLWRASLHTKCFCPKQNQANHKLTKGSLVLSPPMIFRQSSHMPHIALFFTVS